MVMGSLVLGRCDRFITCGSEEAEIPQQEENREDILDHVILE